MPSVHLYGGPMSGREYSLAGWPPHVDIAYVPPEEFDPSDATTGAALQHSRMERLRYVRVEVMNAQGHWSYRYIDAAMADLLRARRNNPPPRSGYMVWA